ncbi:unnamed protein product, partial [Vitis vinifera]
MKATISILLLALFFTLNHSQASLRIPHFNNSTDQDVLLSFKAQVTKDPNGVLDTWKPNTSFCNWHGVLCNPMKNRVTGLTLRNLTLAGTITSYIANLSFLRRLDLQENSFHGTIPIDFGRLFRLVIDLSDNQLQGTIPSELGNLLELQDLSFAKNNLSGNIPSSLGNCSSLNNLILLSNNLQGTIPTELAHLSLLLQLNLGNNNLSVMGQNHFEGNIPEGVGNLRSLIQLSMEENVLTGHIPSTIGNLQNLQSLILDSNYLSGSIPESLGNLTQLYELGLSGNNITGRIPSSLSSYISNNRLSGAIPTTVGLRGIEYIDLSTNNLSALIPSLGTLKYLQLLNLSANKLQGEGPPRLYSYYVLKSATNNFSSENLIGEGSFGCVYRGVMRDGTLAAVKVFNMDQHGASRSFLAECEALRYVRHRNLVKILSACSSPTFKALVLQFMPNGSLEKWLHHGGEDGRQRLNLKQRMDIVVEVASAMEYLHHNCETPVVHCDLKPSNVLLDQDMTAHVGDFGLARILHGAASDHQISSTLGLKGSIGYIAPEYGLGGGVSTKGDVYCFGILVLEMFTGKKPTQEMFSGEFSLRRWVEAALHGCQSVSLLFFHQIIEGMDNESMISPLGSSQLISVTRSLHFVRYQPTSPGPRGQSPRPTHSKPCHVR